MKLREVRVVIADAFGKDVASEEAVRWIDHLRKNGWGRGELRIAPMNYEDLFEFMSDGFPNITRPEWDSFLALCDEKSGEARP